jgi:four helix bundle protein
VDGMVREDSYEKLIVWQKAMDLVDGVYGATEGWPRREIFGMTGQIRRSVVSIPTNIAEGQGRTGPREFLHHLSIAHGSLCETKNLLKIARRRRFIDDEALAPLLRLTTEVSRLLKGLMKRLRQPPTA